jgi:putative acetyltransferase
MIIRPEREGDQAQIRSVTTIAFDGHPYSDGSEPSIIEGLRRAGALSASFVAEENGDVIGHVALSPVDIESGAQRWFGLGPISVLPVRQGKGIGSALMRKALDWLKETDAAGCVLAGDPLFYERFGFEATSALMLKDCAPQYFLALPLSSSNASGMVSYHPAFYGGTS